MNDYLTKIQELLKETAQQEDEVIERISATIANRLNQGGIVQLFGCGHSNLIAQEPFYRAGGLVPVMPIIVEQIMLHHGAVQASINEKDPVLSKTIANAISFQEHDTLIVISNSGRNPVPIEVAQKATSQGIYTVGLLSGNYTNQSHPSKHKSGLRLEDVVDDVLDNHSPVGDGILETEKHQIFGSSSSVVGIALLNAVLTRSIQLLDEQGKEPPIFKSGNEETSKEHNDHLVARFGIRIEF